MIPRDLEKKLKSLASKFPVVALTGPRQSGKTTLSQATFPRYRYISLEDLDIREFALNDPRGFLNTYHNGHGLIIDEVQYALNLLSYIQTQVDATQTPGSYILTGSQNFLVSEKLSQTLAGRVGILTLLPLSIHELKKKHLLPDSYAEFLFLGCYPRIYAQKIAPTDWYPNYLRTYVERDVRQIKNIPDLMQFQSFLKLCAGRVGQLINFSDLGRDAGISYNTAKGWLSILQESYIIYLLPPYHKNFNKRIIKSPKLYFCDTGIACSLLGIESQSQLSTHYMRGHLFENGMVVELLKNRFNLGLPSNCSFWRDKTGHEIDCILEEGDSITAIEIKSSQTLSSEAFDSLSYWNKLTPSHNFVIYGGKDIQKRSNATVLGWNQSDIFNTNRI